MTATHNKSNRISKSKIIVLSTVLLIIGLIILAGIITYESPMQRKLTGFWNVEFENSYMERDSIYEFIGVIINIQDNDTINLPRVYAPLDIDFKGKTLLDEDIFDDKEVLEKTQRHTDEVSRKAKGTWKVISTNPDSVFFNAPENPLHGKYAIRFFIDKDGWVYAKNNIYKMELTNDSTYLICNKAGFMYTNSVKDWEGRN